MKIKNRQEARFFLQNNKKNVRNIAFAVFCQLLLYRVKSTLAFGRVINYSITIKDGDGIINLLY